MEHKNIISRLSNSLLFYFLLSCMNSIELATSITTNNETDHISLLAIKELVVEDPFQVLKSWNTSLHFCKWQGVTCGRRHQRVVILELPSLKLLGSIAPHIGNLTFLKVIELGNNSFVGTIPQEVGRLHRLRHLDLPNNSFAGEIPTNLTHCLNLRTINLNGNNLGGKIPSQLSYLSKLLQLGLADNSLTGTIPPSLGNLSSLSMFSIGLNNLEGSIPHQLGQLSNLEFLQISSNKFSGTFPSQLYNISSIYYLAATGNQFQGHLPSDLGLTLPKLEAIYIGANQFSGPIPTSLPNASGLADISLTQNAFTGPIPPTLGNLKDLSGINFGDNPLGSKEGGDLSFVTSLTNCTNLTRLILNDDHLRGMLPNSIANLSTKLTRLRLERNYITGSIPQEIGNLVNLDVLLLNSNMLTNNIPDSFGKLARLQGLAIAFNNISGKIPSSLGNMSLLSQLALDGNRIEGGIPVSLGNCSNLQALGLPQNILTGSIPVEIFRLPSLTLANLGRNYLTGPLPSQVGALRNLRAFDISENKLSGEIPSTLGNCLMLEFLYIGNNFFEGTIPENLRQLRGLQVLDLSHNNLSGKIPSFLGNFTSIWNLNLSFNMFEGEVPNEGVFKNISAFSVFGNENLCGGIETLQLPLCPANVSDKQGKPFARIVIFILTGSLLVIVVLVVIVCAILYRARRSKGKPTSESLVENQYPKISYAELLRATDGFSLANLIGQGRYGSVYKGTLSHNEQVVAVKVLNLLQEGANKSFMTECEALRNIRHRNLIKIITSCSSLDFKGNYFKALVFELMPNGSLESWLHPGSSNQRDLRNLNLLQRLNIAIDVASALYYLHYQCENRIIHCDLKPSNVLLDNDLCAHVGDFGLAKFLLVSSGITNQTESSTTGIRGTIGYVAPEYGMYEEVSAEGDMYSYGILLLEMFTGKRPTDSMFTENFSLQNYVKMALSDGLMEIVDSTLKADEEDESRYTIGKSNAGGIGEMKDCLALILHIGVICSAHVPRERMDVNSVLKELHVIQKNFLKSIENA